MKEHGDRYRIVLRFLAAGERKRDRTMTCILGTSIMLCLSRLGRSERGSTVKGLNMTRKYSYFLMQHSYKY